MTKEFAVDLKARVVVWKGEGSSREQASERAALRCAAAGEDFGDGGAEVLAEVYGAPPKSAPRKPSPKKAKKKAR